MTDTRKPRPCDPVQPPLSFSAEEIARVRVRPADLARMLGVTRQTVSQWIKTGKVTLGTDGRLDPLEAARQVVRNSDPARLRARTLRAAVEGEAALRERLRGAEEGLSAAQKKIAYLEDFWQEIDRAHSLMIEIIVERWDELRHLSGEEIDRKLGEIDDEAAIAAGPESEDEEIGAQDLRSSDGLRDG